MEQDHAAILLNAIYVVQLPIGTINYNDTHFKVCPKHLKWMC